jgi:hypothetical protein
MSMDLGSVVLPGAQSLVAAMLGDAWATARSAFARRWGRDGADGGVAAEQRLDEGRSQALALAGDGPDRRARLEVFWAGYLAGLLAERPDLINAVREIGAGQPPSTHNETHNTNTNSNTGTVHGSLLQAGDIQGNISF